MRRKIIEQQRQLEANDLNLDLENNKSSAMYNKDLYNGVVQMVEDTRSRYEIEMDNLEQENMAMTNLKKLFGKDNSEIRKSMNVLNFSTDYVKVFNKYFSTIYRDLNGVYNLLASDFQQYFDRFFDKITKTAGVEMPAQESTLAGVQENIDKLQQQTINASDNIKDMVLDSLDVDSLNIAKRLKDYIKMIIDINDVHATTLDPDLRNDMDALGLTDTFITSELPLLGDPTITVSQKEAILDVVKNCKMSVMRALFSKYGAPQPTKTPSTSSGKKTKYNDGVEISHDGNDYLIFGKYLYKKDGLGFYEIIPSLELDKNDDIQTIRTTKPLRGSIQVEDFNTVLMKKMLPASTTPSAPMTSAPMTSSIPVDGTIHKDKTKTYIVFDGFGYKQDALGTTYNTTPDIEFDNSGATKKVNKGTKKSKTINQKVVDYNTALTTPAVAAPMLASGLKKSVNNDKIMKILKKLQMKKITGGTMRADMPTTKMIDPKQAMQIRSMEMQNRIKTKGGSIQQDMSKVKMIKQIIQSRKK